MDRQLLAVAQAFGRPFAWPTLQDGALVQNVLPIGGAELAQSGHGSDALLAWHTEDAFHPDRPDWIFLMGVRNDDQIGTTVASVADTSAAMDAHFSVLFEPKFRIRPDDEHLKADAKSSLIAEIHGFADPDPVPVLTRDRHGRLDLRINPIFMGVDQGDEEAARALKTLVDQLEAACQKVVVRPGEILVINNRRAVHGRESFNARYDGRDRWLKKVIAHDAERVAKPTVLDT
ncbi:MAG: TauD/TfdA family dioxygenase [Nocardioides sp.]